MTYMSEKLIYDRITVRSATAGTNTLRRGKVSPGQVEKIHLVSVENITNAYTSLRIGVYDNGDFYAYFEEKNPVAGEIYFTTDTIIMREGQQLQAVLAGCTAGDHIEVYIHGTWEEEE